MDKPPLFYMTAALFAKLFSPLLPLHDGARLASGFYTALTLLFTGLAGRELFGSGRGWAAAIILIGCLGMLVRAHQLITDLGAAGRLRHDAVRLHPEPPAPAARRRAARHRAWASASWPRASSRRCCSC